MTFTEKIRAALKDQGRKQLWLADKLGVNADALSTKMKRSKYSNAEKFYISSLLNLEN